MEKITLALTLEEANLILACLGEQKYIKVADLVHKIQEQGASQLRETPANEVTPTLSGNTTTINTTENGQ